MSPMMMVSRPVFVSGGSTPPPDPPPSGAPQAPAATLRVNSSTGSDSNTITQVRAGTHKWATLGRAVWGNASRGSPNSVQAAAAGDVVYVEDSVINLTNIQIVNSSSPPWFYPVNSGSSGNPIRIVGGNGVVGSRTELRITDESVGHLIGAHSANYIEWWQFKVGAVGQAMLGDCGPALLYESNFCKFYSCDLRNTGLIRNWPVETYNSGSYEVKRPQIAVTSATTATPTVLTAPGHNITPESGPYPAIRLVGVAGVTDGDYYCTISGNALTLYSDSTVSVPVAGTGGGASGGTVQKLRQDNAMSIFGLGSNGAEVYNCRLGNVKGYGENASGILTYDCAGWTVRKTTCSNMEGCLAFIKGWLNEAELGDIDTYGSWRIYQCRSEGPSENGIYVGLLPSTATSPCYVYGNIIIQADRAFQTTDLVGDPDRDPSYAYFVNNTVVSCGAGFSNWSPQSGANFTEYNNLYYNTARPFQPWGFPPSTFMVTGRIDGNRCASFGQTTAAQLDPEGANTTYSTYANLNTAYSYIHANSVTNTDPNVVDSTNYIPQNSTLRALGRGVYSLNGITNGTTISVGWDGLFSASDVPGAID